MNTSTNTAPNGMPNHQLAYVPTYHFDTVKPCYCRSGKTFGDCCANSKESGKAPTGIHIVNDFLSSSECKRYLRFAEKQKRTWLSVVNSKTETKKRAYKKDSGRITQRVDLGKRQSQADDWFMQACREKLSSFSRTPAEWFESPHMLRYGPGGKYVTHSDAEHYDQNTKQFYRFIDRDFSMLIYLNDDYEGGELNFPWLNYTYRPVAGDLVFFPSNHIFSHESLPIKTGNKYALVSWGAFRGSARVAQARSRIKI